MDKSKGGLLAVVFVVIILYFPVQPVMADIINGDFSQENAGEWSYSNAEVLSDITAGGNGLAFLRPENEDTNSVSEVWQENIVVPNDAAKLLFDIVMYQVGGGPHETDIFTAKFGTSTPSSLTTLYTLESSDSGFIDTYLDGNYTGSYYAKTVSVDLPGPLPLTGLYTVCFELYNDVSDPIKTTVTIDNVRFAPVPVPSAFLLAVIGMFSAAASKKLKV